MLQRLGGAALLAACAYTTADAAGETLMYLRAKELVGPRVHGNPVLQQELGDNLSLGPWYNSSVTFSHSGHIASVTLPCRGDRRASDVRVRLVRKGGLRLPLLYNLVSPEWEVLMMDALLGSEGGLPKSLNLMPPAQRPATAGPLNCATCETGSGKSASTSSGPASSGSQDLAAGSRAFEGGSTG